jgi:hypothetical protein
MEEVSNVGKVAFLRMEPYKTMMGGISKNTLKPKMELIEFSVDVTEADSISKLRGGYTNPRIRKRLPAINAEGRVV